MRALIADDNTVFSRLVAKVLQNKGVHVALATSAAEAADACAEESPDVAIVDFSLSGGKGLDLIARLAARSRHPKLIVTVNERGGALAAMVAKSLDVQDVFFKPFDMRELTLALNEPSPITS